MAARAILSGLNLALAAGIYALVGHAGDLIIAASAVGGALALSVAVDLVWLGPDGGWPGIDR